MRDGPGQLLLPLPPVVQSDGGPLTPIQRVGDFYVKRDDLFEFAGVRGGKVRTCLSLARSARSGLVTAGSRSSPQVNIVARVARELGLPCRAHCPAGELGPELIAAREAGAEIVQHAFGYNSVIVARARADALTRDWTEIPFGMECRAAVEQTAGQVAEIPEDVGRVVVPVGSGMSLAGVLTGLERAGLRHLPVLGLVVGADPQKRLDRYAPPDWREITALAASAFPYGKEVRASVGDIVLDPIYEAKAAALLRPGDLFWIVGIRSKVF
jgi:1-aminocyclopropane-1-carboxylate deaminase/D-cysteine desulfhydrase-like pyridoxal-dependent ACC family enzyme